MLSRMSPSLCSKMASGSPMRLLSSSLLPYGGRVPCSHLRQAGKSQKLGSAQRLSFSQSHQQQHQHQHAKSSKSFAEWYEHHLEKSPVLTKAITGAILWGIGDGVAQVVPHLAQDDSSNPHEEAFEYDWKRTGRAVTFGGVLHAPTSHVHFNFLEWLTHRVGATGLGIPVFKTVMEQFVYWSWISNSMYHGAMGAMQGLSMAQIYDRIADVLWDTQKAQWAFWIPVQLVNFQFVPVRHQLNVVLCTSIVWTALLSMWYPPVKEDKSIPE